MPLTGGCTHVSFKSDQLELLGIKESPMKGSDDVLSKMLLFSSFI
jgi:hypothetical protein